MPTIPKLQKPYALPRPRIQFPVRDRYCDARADQRALHMRRHIITSLRIMPIHPLSLLILRYDAVQRSAHVGAHIGIVVLIERQRAGRVLYEEREQADFVGAEFGELFEDLGGYEVGAAGARGEGEGFLEPGNAVVSC
jgi:hypothetical protein